MDRSSLALIVALVVTVAAVGGFVVLSQDDGDDEGPLTVTDMRGRTVTLPDEVNKVVCLQAGSVRLAAYLGAGDMIVGVDAMDGKTKGPMPFFNHATYRLAVDTSKAIELTDGVTVEDGKMYNVGSAENYKAIQRTNADVILCSEPDRSKLDTLQQQTQIPVVGIHAEGSITVEDEEFSQNLLLAGQVLGKENRALELVSGVDGMLKDLNALKAQVGESEKPGCYVGGMLYMMQGGLYMTTGNYLSFDLAGAKNVMADTNNGNPYMTESKTLAKTDADFIFVDSIKCGASQSEFDQDLSTFSALPAVTDGNIHSLYSYKFYGTNWEAELMNAFYIGHLLHPEIYGDGTECRANVDSVLELFYPDQGIDAEKLASMQGPGAGQLAWTLS